MGFVSGINDDGDGDDGGEGMSLAQSVLIVRVQLLFENDKEKEVAHDFFLVMAVAVLRSQNIVFFVFLFYYKI